MTTAIIVTLAVLFAVYAAFAIPMMFQFRRYCERVALATGREKEFLGKIDVDDDGNNAFEREQWRKLFAKDFSSLGDSILLSEATRLSRKVRIHMPMRSAWLLDLHFLAQQKFGSTNNHTQQPPAPISAPEFPSADSAPAHIPTSNHTIHFDVVPLCANLRRVRRCLLLLQRD